MADPFDIPDVDGLEEGADGELAFDGEIPDVVEANGPAPDPMGDAKAAGLGLADGLLLNNAGELGDLGVLLGLQGGPDHEIGGMEPTYAGQRGEDMSALYALAEENPYGHGAQVAGNIATGAAAGAMAPVSVAGQALAGAGVGAASTGGETGWGDPLAVLTGGAVGGALGAAGGALGKGAAALQRYLREVPGMEGIATTLPSRGEKLVSKLSWGPEVGATGLARNAAKWGGVKAAQAVPPAAVVAAAGPAYATLPTLAWSIQSVLSSGDSGLPPEAEARLTHAAISGDDSKVIAENFKLQQRYPAYAKRLNDELSALNEENP